MKKIVKNITLFIKGFGIYYVDENTIKSINFNIISSDDSQEARAVIRGFRILRQERFFKEIEKPNYIIWMDCGKHFRNYAVSGYLLKELTNESVNGIYSSILLMLKSTLIKFSLS